MNPRLVRVAVLGSTGSIGCNALDALSGLRETHELAALTGHRNISKLLDQARRFRPRWIVATDEQAASEDWSGLPAGTELKTGMDGVREVVGHPEVDLVLAAIVGIAGLSGTWWALEAGKDVALANKESLVAAGPLVMGLARERGCQIIPVDSEHSAIFQALRAGRSSDEVRRIILTASGGPFREYTTEQMRHVSVEDALCHPTWDMGAKITIDSATMMNKALEIIEARWLFDMPAEKIDVVIHPQSIVHSLVEFHDGSVLAQMSPPDMRLPIHYALTYPERMPGPGAPLDLAEQGTLEFFAPDEARFPALGLGREVAAAGGSAGAILNAANESAVALFLDKKLSFHEIVPVCRSVLDHHHFEPNPSLEQLWEADGWARREVTRWITC